MGEQGDRPTQWQVVFYETCSGRQPVREFLDALPAPDRAAVLRNLSLLQEFGLNVGAPLVRAVRGRRKLWELRVKTTMGAIRVFYFAHTGRCFVVLHGFVKKSQKTPAKELGIAERRMIDVLERERSER
jgi:phage-related protein